MTETDGMAGIEALAKGYAEARGRLADLVGELEDEIAKAKRRRLPRLRRLVAETANAKGELEAAIAEIPRLFERPRSRILHGIRVGLQKAKGKLSWDENWKVVNRIRHFLPDQADTLIKTTETPLKGPLARLTAAQLKRLGVRVEEDSDEILIKPADSEIDKLVDALLADAPAEAGEAA